MAAEVLEPEEAPEPKAKRPKLTEAGLSELSAHGSVEHRAGLSAGTSCTSPPGEQAKPLGAPRREAWLWLCQILM